MSDTPATEASKLRVAVALAESLRAKRINLSVALAESASALHGAKNHQSSDWRGCGEPECKKSWAVLLANSEK